MDVQRRFQSWSLALETLHTVKVLPKQQHVDPMSWYVRHKDDHIELVCEQNDSFTQYVLSSQWKTWLAQRYASPMLSKYSRRGRQCKPKFHHKWR